MKKLIEGLKIIFITIIMLVPCIYFGIKNNQGMAGISLISSALTICFINLEKFDYFKGGGFEAKLKDAVEKTVRPVLDSQTVEIKNEINEINEKYWKEIEKLNINAQKKYEYTYDLNLSESSLEILDEINKDINSLFDFITHYHDDVNKKNEELIKLLESKGEKFGIYDYDVSGGDGYFLGVPNKETALKARLKKLEIKLLEKELEINKNNENLLLKLQKSKNELKHMAKNLHIMD